MNAAPLTWRLTLSVEEIYYLCCLLQVTGLIGLDDPFLGLFTEEVDVRLAAAQESLIQRGCLSRKADGTLAIGAGVVGIMAALTVADEVVAATRADPGHPEVRRFVHLRRDGLLEQETRPDGEVDLTIIPEPGLLERRLLDFCGPPPAGSAPGPAFTIHAGELDDARRLARQGRQENCAAALQRARVPHEAAQALAATLAAGERRGSVAVLKRTRAAIQYQTSLAWLAGPRGSWVVTPREESGQPSLRLAPRESTEIARRITASLPAGTAPVRVTSSAVGRQ